jgi:hypothetical protein
LGAASTPVLQTFIIVTTASADQKKHFIECRSREMITKAAAIWTPLVKATATAASSREIGTGALGYVFTPDCQVLSPLLPMPMGPTREMQNPSLKMVSPHSGSSGDDLGFKKPVNGWDRAGLGGVLDDTSNGPHLTETSEHSPIPFRFPNRNYRWNPSTTNPIAELEAEIESLRKQRQKCSHECALLWRWLAEEEAVYAHQQDSYALEEKIRRRRTLETLGQMHMSTWLFASQQDWMIADLHKRIEQLRSASKSQDGKTVTWLPEVSAQASENGLETFLAMMRTISKLSRMTEDGLKEVQSQTTMALGNPNAMEDGSPWPSAMTGKIVDNEQAWKDLLKRLRLDIEDAKADNDVIDRLLKEGEKRDRG